MCFVPVTALSLCSSGSGSGVPLFTISGVFWDSEAVARQKERRVDAAAAADFLSYAQLQFIIRVCVRGQDHVAMYGEWSDEDGA